MSNLLFFHKKLYLNCFFLIGVLIFICNKVVLANTSSVSTPQGDFIIYNLKDGTQSFVENYNSSLPYKYLIISIPKSGTHFLAKILSNLNCEFTKVHITDNVFYDRRGVEDLSAYLRYFVSCS